MHTLYTPLVSSDSSHIHNLFKKSLLQHDTLFYEQPGKVSRASTEETITGYFTSFINTVYKHIVIIISTKMLVH